MRRLDGVNGGGMTELPPDLNAEWIQQQLRTKRIGRHVDVRAIVGSTMDALGALAHVGEPEGTVVIADQQMTGRGRLGRRWLAPAGSSLLLSILFRPAVAPERIGQVMMAVALGTLDVLDEVLPPGMPAALKWPNDVLADGRKLAGLLAEGRQPSEGPYAVLVGLGLNVSQPTGVLPPGATSLLALGIEPPPRGELCVALLEAVDGRYEALLAGTSLVDAWSARLETIGRPVVATHAGEEVRGTAVGIAIDGGLRIETASGEVVTVHAGDVAPAEG